MSDFVYKQMINKVDNTPITGGSFFLRNVETLDEFVMTELPDDPTGSSQGRYVTDDEVPNGVYKIFRVVSGIPTDTGDEVHVEPGRVNHGGSGSAPYYPVTSRIVGDVVHAVAFLSDEATSGSIATINQAMSWAVTNGYSKVCIGTYKGNSSWSDSIQLQIPAGIKDVDLAGASIECTTINLIPVINNSGVIAIHDGTIQGNGTGSTPHVRSDSGVLFYNVRFSGFSSGSSSVGYTTATSGGTATAMTSYVGCTGVRYDGGRGAATTYGGSYIGTQFAIGSSIPYDTSANPAVARISINYADVDGTEVTGLFSTLRSPVLESFVDNSAPFDSSVHAAEALKHLWFRLKNKFPLEEVSYVTESFSGRIDSVYIATEAASDVYNSSIDIVASTITSSSPSSGFVQGAKITKRRFYGETAYNSLSLKIYLSFDHNDFDSVFGSPSVSNYSYWRPKRISIPSSLIKGILVDYNGVSSVIPKLGSASVTPVKITGIHSLMNPSTGSHLGTTPLFGGLVSLTNESPERFAIDFSPVKDDNIVSQYAVIQRAYPMIGHYSSSGGYHLFEIEMTWNNPNFTSIPGPR